MDKNDYLISLFGIFLVSILVYFMYDTSTDKNEFRETIGIQFCNENGYSNFEDIKYDNRFDSTFILCKNLDEDGVWRYSVWLRWK